MKINISAVQIALVIAALACVLTGHEEAALWFGLGLVWSWL